MKINSANEILRILLMKEKVSVSELARKLTEICGSKVYQQTLSSKMIKGTLRFDEMIQICDLLGYEIEFKKIG